jgi:hypothetical protein
MRLYLLCCLLIVAAAALAAPLGKIASPEEREVTALTHRLAVLRMLSSLDLSEAQRGQLLPLLQAQVREMSAIRDAKIQAQPAVEQAMLGLRQAVFANNGIPNKVKNAVYTAEAPYTALHHQLIDDQEGRAEAIWNMLTTAQGARLRRGGLTDEGWVQSVLGAITTPRNNPDRALRWLYAQYGLREAEVDRAVEFGKPIVTKWQERPDIETTEQKLAFLSELLAVPVEGILTEQLDNATAQSILYYLLTQKTLHYLTGEAPLPPVESDETAAVKQATSDVQVLNMVNSLYLTDEQMTALLDIDRRVKARYERTEAERVEIYRGLLPVLRKVVAVAEQKQAVTPAFDAVYSGYRSALNLLNAEDGKTDRDVMLELKGLLTLNQLVMTGNFVPCTVPVQSLTNPERIGQVNDNSGMERALAEIRARPDAEVPDIIARLRERVKKDFRRHHYCDEDVAAAVAQVPEIVADARAMDEAEFALKKSKLAGQLSVPPVRPVFGDALNARLAHYLLSPNLIPMLEERLAGK